MNQHPTWSLRRCATSRFASGPLKQFGLWFLALVVGSGLALATTNALWAQNAIVELYFVPLPEQALFTSFDTINSAATPPVRTVMSIAIGGSTVLYYDQWENGYEAVLNVPQSLYSSGLAGCPAANLAGTQVWGNGNACDGVPPGIGTDTLSNGDVIVLDNTVNIPRNPAQIRFDGGDKIGSLYPIAVTRLAYPTTPGTVLAGGAEVLKTNQWGTSYRAPLGADVAWLYEVTNVGNLPLTSSAVTDSEGEVIACPLLAFLPPGDTISCRAGGIAVAGQYANTGVVTATTQIGPPLTTSDPSHYYGVETSIELKKYTNGADADLPPGPSIESGSIVTWTYVMTNTGNVTLTNLVLTDDQIGVVTCPQSELVQGALQQWGNMPISPKCLPSHRLGSNWGRSDGL